MLLLLRGYLAITTRTLTRSATASFHLATKWFSLARQGIHRHEPPTGTIEARSTIPHRPDWAQPPLQLAGGAVSAYDPRKRTLHTWLIMTSAAALIVWSAFIASTRANAAEPSEPQASTPAASTQAGRFAWPLTPHPKVTRNFEPPETPFGPGHRGVDLEAAPEQQVLAAEMGVVVFAGQVAGHGVVALDHDGGLHTTYLPVTPSVTTGEQIYRSQPIGTVAPGHPGCPVAACLHWGARRGTEYLDPLSLLGSPGRVRLKPWAEGP
ncbi:murein DD-endopeptidase MepM/ murein hydrolase activator NlpD [Amycolatopsis sulphurea]|uniref:Murein DD-endopeptidase MepM/ murein hydrolase activator NlpD n=1 Tax=Amycolatopsis sulphurea TaxID=76022 RepID=A0A2A9F845_9PSEU|nr:murein DD-endopeptidase MepM/ murein hydrolase activator NlpD [Amycolatopsis sulphurea]